MAIEQGTKISQISKMNQQRSSWLIRLIALFLCIGVILLGYWLLIGQFYETTDDAYVNGNLVQVMPEVSGRVMTIQAEVTDLVKKGEPLITLEKADAEIALKNAEEQLALTARSVGQLYNNVEALKANVAVEQDNVEKAKEDYERRKGLIVNSTISVEDFRHAKLALDNATDSLALAKRQLAAAVELVKNTDLYHHPQLMQAEENVRQAYLNLLRTNVYAPQTGYIAKRFAEVGEEVNLNADINPVLMIIVPIDQLWVDANFKESQLKNIRIGQPVKLISDAYGSSVKYQGTVIGLSAGTGSAFDLLPPQNATGNWIKIVQRLPVRIAIDPKQLEEHPLRIGLSMTVSINTRDQSGPVLMQKPEKKIIYKAYDYDAELEKINQKIAEIIQNNVENTHYNPTDKESP